MFPKMETLQNQCFGLITLTSVSDMLTSVVRSWTMDSVPEDVYTEQSKFDDYYTEETQANEIEAVYVKGLIERRLKSSRKQRLM